MPASLIPRAARKPKALVGKVMPQDRLWDLLSVNFPGAEANHRPIDGRRYSVDIAWPALRFAVEVDGYQFHGKYKKGFHRDRDKARLLVLAGWTLFPVQASLVSKDPSLIVEQVGQVLRRLSAEREAGPVGSW